MRNQNQNVYSGQNSGGYYRNVYDDNRYAQNTEKSPYENRTGSYQYGNTYPNDCAQMQQNKDKKPEKKTHQGGFLKKALVCISLGLMFGIFAGLGLYAVQTLTGMSDRSAQEENAAEVEAMADEVEAAAKEIVDETAEAAESSLAGSGIHVTESMNTIVADVSEVVKEVMPAIVSINNHYTEKMSYFGQSIINEADASGSGIIVGQNDTELLIVTNYHVIADTDKLTVQFVEGSEAEASVKGTDADMDLAVIAVPIGEIDNSTMQNIAVATLGDSDALVVGEPAIAIGNSLGYGQSVTTGVISALDRTIDLSDGTDGTFIQTDAAINPGNSGGALLNMKGEVIGINSNKIGGSAVEGMGYAIPISSASPIIAELMLKETKNKVAEDERGYLGISGISVTDYVSETYGMPKGVYISQVYENTAAAEAGLRKGDIITEFDGEQIESMDELQYELEFHAKGDTVELTVMSADGFGYTDRKVQMVLGNRMQE
ncbi:MAG: trypsin-like peptidase domain-containing protein [Lachnospiraceae bacterium]|nr:trypsin-like peptidase domain-containing protein [Lachnospiraceae bacterium]